MKSISNALKQHLSNEVTSVCMLWKITRRDGQIFGFTDHDTDIVLDGITYLASTGFTPTDIETTAQLNVDNLEIEGVLNSDTITDTDLVAGKWDYAAIEVKLVNYTDLTQGSMWMRAGHLGEVKTGRVTYYAELRGKLQNLQQTIGRVFTSSCNANFCDSRCGLSKATYTTNGTIDSVTNAKTFHSADLTQADGYFKGGLVEFLTGDNAGVKMEVKDFTAGIITLQESLIYPIFAGDTFSVLAGCDKTFAKCKTFNNTVNFRGFPHLPGRDKIIGGY